MKVFYSHLLPGDIIKLHYKVTADRTRGLFQVACMQTVAGRTLCTCGILIRNVLMQEKVVCDPILP